MQKKWVFEYWFEKILLAFFWFAYMNIYVSPNDQNFVIGNLSDKKR